MSEFAIIGKDGSITDYGLWRDILDEDELPLRVAGGPGSGNFGHAGRPGQVGGSTDDSYVDDGGSSWSAINNGAIKEMLDFHATRSPAVKMLLDELKRRAGKGDARAREVHDETVVRLRRTRALGGLGSGNFGHAGRPGQVGGSSESDAAEVENQTRLAASRADDTLANPSFVMGLSSRLHGDAQRYVAAYGQHWTAAKLPSNVEHGTPKECYKNASLLVMMRDDLSFVEGFAKTGKIGDLVFAHAWAVDRAGNVIDPTWSEPENAHYFGVKYERKAYLRHMVKTRFFGVLGGDADAAKRVIHTGSKALRALGGSGSGNFGHAGRPGEVGGSSRVNVKGQSDSGGEFVKTPLPQLKGREIREAVANAYQPVIDAYGHEEEIDPREVMSGQKTVYPERLKEYQNDPTREADVAPGRGGSNTLVVVRRSGKMAVIDGNHRLAAKALSGGRIKVIVVDMDKAWAEAEESRKEGEGIGLALMNAAWARLKALKVLGGPGSGNFGHEGRPGLVGGSGPGRDLTGSTAADFGVLGGDAKTAQQVIASGGVKQ